MKKIDYFVNGTIFIYMFVALPKKTIIEIYFSVQLFTTYSI